MSNPFASMSGPLPSTFPSSSSPSLPPRRGRSTASEDSSKRMKNVLLLILVLGGALPVLLPIWDFFTTQSSLSSFTYIYPPEPARAYTDQQHLALFKHFIYSGEPSILFCINSTLYYHYGGDGGSFTPPKLLQSFIVDNDRLGYGFHLYAGDCYSKWNSERGTSLINKFSLNIPKFIANNPIPATLPAQLEMGGVPVIYAGNLKRPKVLDIPIYNITHVLKYIHNQLTPTISLIRTNEALEKGCFMGSGGVTPAYCVLILVAPTYTEQEYRYQNGLAAKASIKWPTVDKSSPSFTSPNNFLLPSDRDIIDKIAREHRTIHFHFINRDLYELSLEKVLPPLESFVKHDWPRIVLIKKDKNPDWIEGGEPTKEEPTQESQQENDNARQEEEDDDDGPAAREAAESGVAPPSKKPNPKGGVSRATMASSSKLRPFKWGVKVYRESIDYHLVSLFLNGVKGNSTKLADLKAPLTLRKAGTKRTTEKKPTAPKAKKDHSETGSGSSSPPNQSPPKPAKSSNEPPSAAEIRAQRKAAANNNKGQQREEIVRDSEGDAAEDEQEEDEADFIDLDQLNAKDKKGGGNGNGDGEEDIEL